MHLIDPTPFWDFEDPAASEARFRERARAATSRAERDAWLTQVARAQGLQSDADAAHALLDGLDLTHDEVRVRCALERGRLLRSGGLAHEARPHFESACVAAQSAGLDDLWVDALHMVALMAEGDEQVRLTEEALVVAEASADPAARHWRGSLLNNLGMAHADAGRFHQALSVFREALEARRADGDDRRRQIAEWMVAWALRHLGRTDEARAVQLRLRDELAHAGVEDPYVDDELALLESAGDDEPHTG